MSATDQTSGAITTVRGDVPSSTLGVTLPHEHVLVDLTRYFHEDDDPIIAHELTGKLRMQQLGSLRRSLVTSFDDLILDDDETAVSELSRFKLRGGGTVCEMSCHGIRQPAQAERLQAVSTRTGVNIVMGTGAYVASHHPPTITGLDEQELAELFYREITDGVGLTGIRCGILGEIGLSTPPTAHEITVLRAAGVTQLSTGVAISIHQTDPAAATAHTALDVLTEIGVPAHRIVIGHIVTIADVDQVIGLLARGCFVAFDTLGLTGSMGGFEFPSDRGYVERTVALVSAGFGSQILLSHDVGHKRHLRGYGGVGYDHLLITTVPMLSQFLSAHSIKELTVGNPARMLARPVDSRLQTEKSTQTDPAEPLPSRLRSQQCQSS